MASDSLGTRAELLRAGLTEFQKQIRQSNPSAKSSVVSAPLRRAAASLAERWLVEFGGSSIVRNVVGEAVVAELSVQFQRLLTFSERRTIREKYDQILRAILPNFSEAVTIPLKQAESQTSYATIGFSGPTEVEGFSLREASIAFLAQSFAPEDQVVNQAVRRCLGAFGWTVLSGEKPRAESISKKVKARIDQADVFVGIFTRRDQLKGKNEWTTSAWVIEEKAYAIAMRKKLLLIREDGVGSIGGLQGDYEFLPFERANLLDLVLRIVETYMSVG